MAKKKLTNVMDLATKLEEEKEFARDLAYHLDNRTLVHKLIAMRAARGLTQEEVAAKMGCTQGRISKLETSDDLDLTFASIVHYAHAIGLRLEITLTGEETTAVDRVKHHAFCIKRLTDQLARLAFADETIARGVSRFFDEAAINLLRMLQDSADKRPHHPEQRGPLLVVDMCGVDESEAPELLRK